MKVNCYMICLPTSRQLEYWRTYLKHPQMLSNRQHRPLGPEKRKHKRWDLQTSRFLAAGNFGTAMWRGRSQRESGSLLNWWRRSYTKENSRNIHGVPFILCLNTIWTCIQQNFTRIGKDQALGKEQLLESSKLNNFQQAQRTVNH